MARALLLLALVALVAAATGCAGDGETQLSQDEYQQELDEASTSLGDFTRELGTAIAGAVTGGGSYEEAADELADVRDELDETADELDSVSPPEDAADAHERLVAGLREYSGDLTQLEEAIESGDREEIVRLLGEVESLDSVEALREAGADLEELGYTFDT